MRLAEFGCWIGGAVYMIRDILASYIVRAPTTLADHSGHDQGYIFGTRTLCILAQVRQRKTIRVVASIVSHADN